MDDDMAARLAAMFPGDLVPSDEPPDTHIPMRVRRQILRGTVQHDPPPSPETARKFRQVLDRRPPITPTPPPALTTPSVPARQYLLETPSNVTRWLEEAKDIESDVKLGQAAEPHRVTRLMLEAIPVVEQFTSRS